jgi:hypothetical protein
MDKAEPSPLSDTSLPPEPSRGPFLGLAIGLALILIVVVALIVSSRTSPTRNAVAPKLMESGTADPYAANLQLSDVNLSAADNFAGGTSYYVEGKVTNTGNKVVNGATVEIAFKNSLGQVVQRETQTLMVILARQPAIDVVALNGAPLNPSQSRDFRLTFERISADWDRQKPELRVITVSWK